MVRSIKQLQFTKKSMNFQDFTLKINKNIIKHISHNQSYHPKQTYHLNLQHKLSESKHKANFIKINKNKLPNDFFQKKANRRVSEQKIYYAQQFTQPVLHARRIESERLIYSPDKTSFFGFQEEKPNDNSHKMTMQPSKIINRKFQTRQEPKRDVFAAQIARKITNTSKTSKRDLLELFPPTFDDRMNDIISESRSHVNRITPKRQLIPIQRQSHMLVVNPQKMQKNECKFTSARKHKEMAAKLANISVFDNQASDGMNITFYNAKSNCLPPIIRQNP